MSFAECNKSIYFELVIKKKKNPKPLLASAVAKTTIWGPEKTLFSTNLLQSADRGRVQPKNKTILALKSMQTGFFSPLHSPPPPKGQKTAELNHTEKCCLWLPQKNASNSHQMGDNARGYFVFSAIASLLERLLRLVGLAVLRPGFVSSGGTIVSSPFILHPPALRKRRQKPLFVERR